MKTSEVLDALERRHPDEQGEWAFLREALGIDALAIHCWQGKKPFFERVGYEVKVSRSDFLRELKNPRKREPAMAIVDRFYFAAPWGLIKLDEVPEGCGLIQVYAANEHRDARTHRTLTAPRLEPRGLTRREVSALIRYRVNPNQVRALKARAHHFETRANSLMDTLSERVDERDAAFRRLEGLLGGTVAEGQMWMGPTRKVFGSFGKQLTLAESTGTTQVRVMEVRHYEDSGTVAVAPVEHVEGPSWNWERLRLGEFLALFQPVEVAKAV